VPELSAIESSAETCTSRVQRSKIANFHSNRDLLLIEKSDNEREREIEKSKMVSVVLSIIDCHQQQEQSAINRTF
jgi:hypothetical protein